MSSNGSKMAAAVWPGDVYVSDDMGATWTPRVGVGNWSVVLVSADGQTIRIFEYDGYMFRSTDGGENFSGSGASRKYWYKAAMSSNGDRIVAATLNSPAETLFYTNNGGVTWAAKGPILQACTSLSISSDGYDILATGGTSALYISGNGGDTWTARETPRMWYGGTMSSNAGIMMAVEENGQIFTSTDKGVKWNARGPNVNWYTASISGNGQTFVAAGRGSYLYVPSNWTTVGAMGSIQGNQYDTLELQYMGSGKFNAINALGTLSFF